MNPLRNDMLQLATGYWLSKALYCAAKAEVAERLEGGPRPVAELATAAGVQADALHRVLRALASVGIFEELAPREFGLTEKAQFLRGNHPESVKHFALMVGGDLFEAWSDLYHTLETGQSAVEKRFGRDFFAEIAQDLQKSTLFDRAMQEIHGSETALMLEHFDFARFETVLDVGGGNGSTVCGLLHDQPALRAQLFDLPHVIENARRFVAEVGFAERVEFLPGDFFKQIEGNSRCVILRHVLHDWNDEQAVTILRNAKAALAPGGSLLVVEKVITPGNAPEFAKLLDLNMLAIGGKERTEAQYRELFQRAGLELHKLHVTPGAIDLIEARATG